MAKKHIYVIGILVFFIALVGIGALLNPGVIDSSNTKVSQEANISIGSSNAEVSQEASTSIGSSNAEVSQEASFKS